MADGDVVDDFMVGVRKPGVFPAAELVSTAVVRDDIQQVVPTLFEVQ